MKNKNVYFIIVVILLILVFTLMPVKNDFFNATFDGIGVYGNPYIFYPLLLGSIFFFINSNIYAKTYYCLCVIDLIIVYWLFDSTPPIWLQKYALWFQDTFTFVTLKKADIHLKILVSLIYITIPIKLFLFIKHVQKSPLFTREFIISPLRRDKTRKTGDYLFTERNNLDRKTGKKHSYFKMFFYLIVLFASILCFLMTLTFMGDADLLQSATQGGFAFWLDWNIRILFFVIFTGTFYLMVKDWIIVTPMMYRELKSRILYLIDSIVNVYLNFKHRND